MEHYKGKGEHSVKQLEKIVEDQLEKIYQIKIHMQSYEYWLTHYSNNQMTTQKQAWNNLKEKLNNIKNQKL